MITKNSARIMNGSKVVIETLKELGVDVIFGYPGGIVLDLYDELYNQKAIRHILVRHEQSAVHSAEGYARVTGKCGVVLVTSGPGATNTVSGIVNAYLDGYPLVVLTGQVFSHLIGKDAFQEANICDMTKSCTKKVFQITHAKDIQSTLLEAFKIANQGKKGPVVVDLAKNIFSEKVEYQNSIQLENFENNESSISEDFEIDSSVSRIYNLIKQSSKPVVVSGGGVVHAKAEDELYKFVKTLNIPIVDTMMGLGTYPQEDSNYLGMIGIFGDKAANEVLKESDLVISLGARFNDRITCMFKDIDLSKKFVQIDINKNEISRVIESLDGICADAKIVLEKMNKLVEPNILGKYEKWLSKAIDLKALNVKREKRTNLLHSFEVIRKIENFTADKSVIFTSEVGQHQLWAVQNLKFNKDRRILVSGGAGTMGFGFPAGIGACIANPSCPVVCITGDGSFQMGEHELATCVDYNLDLKIMVMNNGYLGMVRQLQEKNCMGHYSQTKISNPDFLKLAESYGVKALRVTSVNDIDKALEQAFSTKGTFLIDFLVEPMELL